jgi:hypothetical protein
MHKSEGLETKIDQSLKNKLNFAFLFDLCDLKNDDIWSSSFHTVLF